MATSTSAGTSANPNEKSDVFSKFKMPNIDHNAVLDSCKKNLEMMWIINKMSVEVLSGVAKLQGAFMKQLLSDYNNAAKSSKPSEALSKFSELAHGHLLKAIGNSKQVSEMLTSASKDVHSTLTGRFKESMEEAKHIVKK
ncbi:MAG: phasin family protein [Holosporaceae bacterium]|jgi:hypothetical protein|nr:phasin family protein [Holosporaceae bacterium]